MAHFSVRAPDFGFAGLGCTLKGRWFEFWKSQSRCASALHPSTRFCVSCAATLSPENNTNKAWNRRHGAAYSAYPSAQYALPQMPLTLAGQRLNLVSASPPPPPLGASCYQNPLLGLWHCNGRPQGVVRRIEGRWSAGRRGTPSLPKMDSHICCPAFSCPEWSEWREQERARLAEQGAGAGNAAKPGGAPPNPPPPPDQSDHRGKNESGKSGWAIFGAQTFGSQTPSPHPRSRDAPDVPVLLTPARMVPLATHTAPPPGTPHARRYGAPRHEDDCPRGDQGAEESLAARIHRSVRGKGKAAAAA